MRRADDALTGDELCSLRDIKKGLARTVQPATEHLDKLHALGHIAKIRGEYIINEAGNARLKPDLEEDTFRPLTCVLTPE